MNRKYQHLVLLLGALLALTIVPTLAQRAPEREYSAEQRVPSWMVGTFEGSARNDGAVIALRIGEDGVMSATGSGGSRRKNDRMSVRYRGDLLTVDGFDYRVQQSRNGFTAVATDKRNGRIEFRRTGGSSGDRIPETNSRVPSWMIGHFDGRSSKTGQIFNLRVTSDGHLTAKDRLHGEVANYFDISYRRNTLTIEGRDYSVERTRDGFRAIPLHDRIDRKGRSSDPYGQINFTRLNRED
jgi:hypothetical protein